MNASISACLHIGLTNVLSTIFFLFFFLLIKKIGAKIWTKFESNSFHTTKCTKDNRSAEKSTKVIFQFEKFSRLGENFQVITPKL